MELIFHSEQKRNSNQPIGKHTTNLKSAEGSVKIEIPLIQPKIRSLSR